MNTRVETRSKKIGQILIKRVFDLFGGIIGLFVLVPAIIFVKALFIFYGDFDTIWFTQERVGLEGKLFRVVKFRTMHPGAEDALNDLMNKNPELKAEYVKHRKLGSDPRITKAGRFLRRNSIDELPQLLNVLIGDMSLVGPRPYLPEEITDMGDLYGSIVSCKPGITGFWQVNGRSTLPFSVRLKYDDYYCRNWSLPMDLNILLKTFTVLSSKEGAL